MGLTNLKVRIANPADLSKGVELLFLVDSGATYTVVDEKILKKIGIKPAGEREFILANGQTMKRKFGGAFYEYKGEKGFSDIVFGKPGDSTLLGVTTLESLGLALDPIRRQLFQLPMVLGGMK